MRYTPIILVLAILLVSGCTTPSPTPVTPTPHSTETSPHAIINGEVLYKGKPVDDVARISLEQNGTNKYRIYTRDGKFKETINTGVYNLTAEYSQYSYHNTVNITRNTTLSIVLH